MTDGPTFTRQLLIRLVLGLGALQPAAAAADQVAVVDGDSLRARGVRIRLPGIDAPELGQTCVRPGAASWPCGVAARDALRRLTAGDEVTCRAAGEDRYGRTLSECAAGGEDLGRWMVRHGWAVAAPESPYGEEERLARAMKLGVWSGRFERPSRWRARHPRR